MIIGLTVRIFAWTPAPANLLKTSRGTGFSLAGGRAGAEARISERLSLKGEYLYLHMADKNVVYIPANNKNIDFGNNAHLIRVGLNFAFN